MTHPVGPEHKSALEFERVVTREAVFIDLDGEYERFILDEAPDLDMKLEVRISRTAAGKTAYVLLRGVIDCPAGKNFFAKLSAAVEGTFSVKEGSTDRLAEFARLQAPVLLLPYLRAVFTELTAGSRGGAFILPPLNMMSLVQKMAEAAPDTIVEAASAKQ